MFPQVKWILLADCLSGRSDLVGDVNKQVDLNILLIDNLSEDKTLIHKYINSSKSSSCKLLKVDSLEAGIECVEKEKIDLVLLDLDMLDSHGFSRFQLVSASKLNIPLIIIVRDTDLEAARKAIQIGAQDYLVIDHFDEFLLERTIINALERNKLFSDYRVRESNLREIINKNQDGIIVVNKEGKIVFSNPAAQILFNKNDESLINENFGYPIIEGDSTEIEITSTPGSELVVEMRAIQVFWANELATLITLHDVSEQKRYEMYLHDLSIMDDLTSLFNRRGFMVLAENQLKIAPRRNESSMTMIYIDVDNLKYINDTHGHQVGDQALLVLAKMLQNTFRGSDIIGRLGGDEFAVLALDTDVNYIDQIIDRLRNKVSNFNLQNEHPFHLSVSIGTSSYLSTNPKTLKELLKEADKQQYEEKYRKKHSDDKNITEHRFL